MKLKSTLYLLLFLQACIAQSKDNNFYLGIKFGNNFQLKSKEDYNIYRNDANPINELEGVQTNYGFFFGYMISKNLGLELGLNSFNNSNTIDKQQLSLYNYKNSSREETFSMKLIKPTVVISGGYKKVNPYSKIALVIAQSVKINYSEFAYDYINYGGPKPAIDYPSSLNYNNSNDEKQPLGFNTVLGLEYKIFKEVYVFGELDYFYLQYTPKTILFKSFQLTDYDAISGPTYDYFINYIDSSSNPEKRGDTIYQDILYLKQLESIRTRVINNVNFNIGFKLNL